MSRKEKMKIYHGIPKSVTDEHTIFYIDFDEDIPNIYYEDSRYKTIRGYKDSNTGLSTNRVIILPVGNFDLISNPFTIDVWVENIVSGSTSDEWGNLVGLGYITQVENFFMKKIFALVNASYKTPNTVTGIETPIIPNSYLKTDEPIHLRVAYDGDKTIRGYVNGQKVKESIVNETELLNYQGIKEYFLGINIGHNYQVTRNNCYVSEFHISNIDRGDYFPNLPQDFIDGKAIIKPRMNQQQIKGDPLYSQETTNIVKIGTNVNEPQITCSRTTGNWTSSDTIKVKGLNGEVISGVIDTDTALCRGIKYVKEGTDAQLQVDDVSKLAVNDIVRFIRVMDFMIGKEDIKITAIDPLTNIITLSGTGSTYNNSELALGWNLIVEATATSSSPIVKSEDGTTVVGTWSGLGTREATFTLGTNTGLSGKDLYVTYSLNIPNGNSDFPELPYSVDRAYNEVGLEMKPVSEIVIEDDFKGKIVNSNKECPHFSGWYFGTSLGLSSVFKENGLQSYYNELYNLDETLRACSTLENAQIPQQIFSFNLIEMVERKFGEIPNVDKVKWLNEHLEKVTLKWSGKASCPGGNKVYLAPWRNDLNNWDNYWINQVRHNSDTIIRNLIHVLATNKNGYEYIKMSLTQDGLISFIAFTDPSDGETNSIIYTDYVKLEITLKTDSTFTTLYCDNKRAREDSCNPVLVQKETKTVKRYLPSKECFVTECSYATIPSASVQLPVGAKKVSSHGRYFLSSKGTGSVGSKICNAEYLGQFLNKDILYKYSGSDLIEIPYSLFVDKSSNNDYSSYFTQLELLDIDDNAIKYLLFTKANIGYKSSHGISRGFSKHLSLLDNKPESSFYGIAIYLVRYNNELYLLISNAPYNFDMNTNKEGVSDLYKLPNRPLIK